MVRIVRSLTSNEMKIDDGFNSSLLNGVIFITVGTVTAFYVYPFVASPRVSFIHFEIMAFPAVFIIVGCIFLLSASWTTLVITRGNQQMAFYKKRLLGSELETFDTKDIRAVEFRREYKMEKFNDNVAVGSGFGAILRQPFLQPRPVLVSQLMIVLKNGRQLPLTREKDLIPPLPDTKTNLLTSVATQISSFIGCPLEQTTYGSPTSRVSNSREGFDSST